MMGLTWGGDNVPNDALRRRVRYCPPWKLTRWGLVWNMMFGRVMWPHRGCDEYHNKSWFILIPLVGEFTYFSKPGYQTAREHLYGMGPDGVHGFVDPSCEICDEIMTAFMEEW
jgi:hypothetical protein